MGELWGNNICTIGCIGSFGIDTLSSSVLWSHRVIIEHNDFHKMANHCIVNPQGWLTGRNEIVGILWLISDVDAAS